MKTLKQLAFLLLASTFFVTAACGRRSDLEHRVRNYEVVEEGSAGGVTTSLGGEQPALTATDVDTTTDLSLIPGSDTTMTATAPPGSLAETLAIEPAAAAPQRSTPPGAVASRPPATVRQTAPSRQTPAREEPAPTTPPREEPAPEQPPAEQTPPPTSTTPTTTSTQPQEEPPPTQTAPPPTQTNPNGGAA